MRATEVLRSPRKVQDGGTVMVGSKLGSGLAFADIIQEEKPLLEASAHRLRRCGRQPTQLSATLLLPFSFAPPNLQKDLRNSGLFPQDGRQGMKQVANGTFLHSTSVHRYHRAVAKLHQHRRLTRRPTE